MSVYGFGTACGVVQRARVMAPLGAALLLLAGLALPTLVLGGDAAPGGPAVSGPNGKISIEGGQSDGDGDALGLGSYTIPLGPSYGLQLDGALGYQSDEVLGGVGAHLFARDPSTYLLGLYGSYHTWNGIDIWRAAAEFELYHGRFSVSGLAGIEGVEFPGSSGGVPVLNQDNSHFFGQADLAYYLTDDLMLSAGYHYLSETSFGSVGMEYLLQGGETPVSLFANGRFGENSDQRLSGGVKVYFGADKVKSLIARHRTEDPQNYTPVFPFLVTQAATVEDGPSCGNGILEEENMESCDDGNNIDGDGCDSICQREVNICPPYGEFFQPVGGCTCDQSGLTRSDPFDVGDDYFTCEPP